MKKIKQSLDDKKLLKLGKDRGFVTQEEILQVFPTPENTIDELDNFYIRLKLIESPPTTLGICRD